MAGSLNRVTLIGRLTDAPVLRTLADSAVCNFSVATTRHTTDTATGRRKEISDFHDVVVWNNGSRRLADVCGEYLQKGRLVAVEGRLQTRSWEDPGGQRKSRTEVIASDVQFLDSARGEQQ